jgi:hypothetical protein
MNRHTEENLEGWFSDPYGRHETRWLSGGKPTRLVRDCEVEGYDDQPDEPPTRSPVRIHNENVTTDSHDLRRADDAQREAEYEPGKALRRGTDYWDTTTAVP